LTGGRKRMPGNRAEEKLARVTGAQRTIEHRARVATQSVQGFGTALSDTATVPRPTAP
jgi:hypothetical protein